MAAWCFGRLGDNLPSKVCKRLMELLKDNYWKVRTAACVAIGVNLILNIFLLIIIILIKIFFFYRLLDNKWLI